MKGIKVSGQVDLSAKSVAVEYNETKLTLTLIKETNSNENARSLPGGLFLQIQYPIGILGKRLMSLYTLITVTWTLIG